MTLSLPEPDGPETINNTGLRLDVSAISFMTLDSWLVARLARELDGMLAGARVTDLRTVERGLSLACYRRRAHLELRAAFDPDHPLAAAIERRDQTNESGPGGWAGGVAPLLRGSVVEAVQAVPDDRILNVDTSSRSAFGVPAKHRLVLELEPRKPNALVLRPIGAGGWSILAAARQFASDGASRAIVVGEPYAPPPARVTACDRATLLERVAAALASPEPQLRAIVRLMGEFDPACTPPLARSLIAELDLAPTVGVKAGELLLERWTTMREQVARAATDLESPLYVYRRGGQVVACHLVPLRWPEGDVSRAASLDELCAAEIERGERARIAPASASLRKRLERMLKRCDEEMESLRAAQQRGVAAEDLRASGDAIYANLSAVAPEASVLVAPDGTRIALNPLLTAKQNAAEYFKRYKKARSGLPRVAARLERIGAMKPYWEHLLWELDRADADPSLRATTYDEVAAAIPPRVAARSASARGKQKGALRERATTYVELGDGAVAFVGRSPRDNERLTFSVARPEDLWFHARGIPGAHVILKLAHAGETPTDEQIARAAALAAGASRAADAAKVDVDYTQRKHVRRQGKGATGLVWYTDFKTILVTPERR